jgi:hypothetical protein
MILGIVGFMGSGKGTLGEMLNERGFSQDSFAKPVKDCVSIIFNLDRGLLEGNTPVSRAWRNVPDKFWSEKFGKSFTPRMALQLFGTEACRNGLNNNIWTDSLIKRVEGVKHSVITDVRFRNEFTAIQNIGGKIVRIKRGPDPEWFVHLSRMFINSEREVFMNKYNIHVSEWDWVGLKPDFIIENNGTLQELENNVEYLLESIFLKNNDRVRDYEINK